MVAAHARRCARLIASEGRARAVRPLSSRAPALLLPRMAGPALLACRFRWRQQGCAAWRSAWGIAPGKRLLSSARRPKSERKQANVCCIEPLALRCDMHEKSLQTLEYPKILERLAHEAAFSASKELALALTPATDLREVE